jgi:hypothetical protein
MKHGKDKTMRKSNAEETLGQRIFTAVVSFQLGISMERARKLYVTGPGAPLLDPSWEAVGAELIQALARKEVPGDGSLEPEPARPINVLHTSDPKNPAPNPFVERQKCGTDQS